MSIHQMFYNGLTTIHTACCVSAGALLLTSCSSPPKPPSVDESTKRPVNARVAVDLKACQGDLSRASILVTELSRAGIMTAASTKTSSLPNASKAAPAGSPIEAATGNIVAVVPFGLGSASWGVEPADAAAIVRRANSAEVVMIRGRTDAPGDTLQETALARRRAEAAAGFLQAAGIPRDKLRLTWQGAGDPVSGLQPTERGQNRRVEIEFYNAAPRLVSVRTSSRISTDNPAPGVQRSAARTETTASL